MKNIFNFIGKALSFDFVQTFAIKKGIAYGAAAVVGLIFGPSVSGHLPAALPGDPAAWTEFISACLAGLYAAGVNAAKHYGANK